MPNSSSVDIDSIISTFYEATLNPNCWQDGLEQLASIIDAQGAALVIGDLGRVHASIAFNVGNPAEAIQAYNNYYNTLDPLLELSAHYPVGLWMNDRRDVNWTGQRPNEYYHDFLLKHGMYTMIASALIREGDLMASISIQRFAGQESFSREDETKASRILPHIQRAARLHHKLQQLGIRADVGIAALDQITTPILITEGSGTVLVINRAAEQLFQRHSMISVRHGKLSTAQQMLAIRQAITDAARVSGARSSGLRMRGNTEADDVDVLVMPLPVQSMLAGPWQRPLVLIVLHRCGTTPPGIDQLLHDLYGLTPMEARVARLLADGASPAETAGQLLIAVSTIRSHLKAIFSKTGLRRQAELTRLIATLANIGNEAR